jgi:integrase/recombinase XerC
VVRDFVLWARQADKFTGAKNPPGARLPVNWVTGKKVQTARYAPATINHTLSSVHEFYEFYRERGEGPLINPVPVAGRPHAHHNPMDAFAPTRRRALRQKESQPLPRAIPDASFNELFRKLKSHRDRALAAFYVSSGARASELLGLTGDMINYGDQLIGVVRKGGARQWLPASPDAFVWLRLYQLDRGTPGDGQPVWLTLREPHRPLTYDALRAVMGRVNRLLGANWTLHDLRHTFAIRALDGGVPVLNQWTQSRVAASTCSRPVGVDQFGLVEAHVGLGQGVVVDARATGRACAAMSWELAQRYFAGTA